MSPATTRLIGVIFMVAAAVLMILNLKRVANLGSYWVALPLFIVGIALLARSRRGR
jgi:membrane-bound ClpP family serine protease